MTSFATPADLSRVRIRAQSGRSPVDLREIFRYRELLWTLADRDVRVRYKQTAIGVAWVVLQPLLTSLIFAFVFGVVAGLSSDGVPYLLFAFAGLMAWNTFSASVTRVSTSLLNNTAIVTKIYFPRLILPISTLGATLIDFGVSMGMMVVLLAAYRVWPGWGILLLPVWLAVLLTLATGIGLAAGAMMVRYRDIGIIIPVALQMAMYVSPVAWSTTLVPGRFRWVLMANPLSGLIDAFRWSLLGQGQLSAPALAYSVGFAALVFWAGAVIFKHQERTFADVI